MEIEVKYKCKNFEKIIKIVRTMGFKLIKEKHQIDSYFFASKKSKDGTWDYLRIREENKKYSFDHHRVLNDMEAEEREIKIEDKNKLIEIMKFLGHEIICVVDKKRKEYSKNNITIVFDRIKNLGNFVEVELIGESNNKNREIVLELAKKLGLDKKDRVEGKGYPDLMLEMK